MCQIFEGSHSSRQPPATAAGAELELELDCAKCIHDRLHTDTTFRDVHLIASHILCCITSRLAGLVLSVFVSRGDKATWQQ